MLESNIADYIKGKGINLSAMSRATGIPYGALYDTFFHDERKGKREIRGKELLAVCDFLEKSPMDFRDPHDKQAG